MMESMRAESMRQSSRLRMEPEKASEPFVASASSVNPSDVSVSSGGGAVQRFFRRKEEELGKKEARFSKVLDSKEFQSLANQANNSRSLSKFSRFSKSSIRREEEQLRGVIEQHKKMLTKLQGRMRSEEELNEFEKNLLKEEKNRYLMKVEELEAEIEQLYRDNYRLRELDRTKQPVQPVAESFHVDNLNERSKELEYKPYVISTRNNDLNRINTRNFQRSKDKDKEHPEDLLGNKLEREKPITAENFFNKKPNNFGLYHEKFPPTNEPQHEENYILKDLLGSSFDHPHPQLQNALRPPASHASFQNASVSSMGGNHFDTFQMANTLSYVNDSVVNESRQMISMSSTTSTRNKVAFFKNSLVLVRDAELEIAYKRSEMNQTLDKLRIIFYINNKTNTKKNVNFHYEYQQQYFAITVIEKLATVEGNSQGRQVIEVQLISKSDLNGVTDMHVAVGSKTYDLWLPATFIRFRRTDRYRMQNNEEEMAVVPDRQFASLARMEQVAPVMLGGRDAGEEWAYLFGECRFGSFTAKLTWREKQLVIEATDKWIDFLGFVLHFFK